MNSPPPPWKADADGATLLIIYHDPTANFSGTITINDGMMTQNGLPAITDNIFYPPVCSQRLNERVFSQFADLQNFGPVDYEVDNTNMPVVQSFWGFEDNPASFLPAQSISSYSFSSQNDCYHWILNGTYYQCSPVTNIVSSMPAGYCIGSGSVTLTADPFDPTLTYQWFQNGNLVGTGQQILVSPSQTTTYDLVVSMTACNGSVLNYSTALTVNVFKPIIPQLTGTDYLCNNSNYTYSVTNNTDYVSFNWTCSLSPGGAPFGSFSGQGTSSIALTPPFPSGYDIEVTVQATDANGCVATSTYLAYKCCDAGIGGTNITTGTYNYLVLAAGPPIAIQDNILLTGNCLFTNPDIRISPGVSITVQPGASLRIDQGAILYSCSAMWQGIIVQPGGQLIFQGNSVIEDAEAAITSIGGAYIKMQNAILNRNYKGLVFETYPIQHPAQIGLSIMSPNLRTAM